MDAIAAYIADIKKTFATGQAREHAYRPALRDLLQSLKPMFDALNEPPRTLFGAVDMVVFRKQTEIGWVEAKDMPSELDDVEETEQLLRYRGAFPNLLLTDYLHFRWYVDGTKRMEARLGRVVDKK